MPAVYACTPAEWPAVRRTGSRLVGDFDGDGRRDRAVRMRETRCDPAFCRTGIAVTFATGQVERLGIGPATWARVAEDGTLASEATIEDFGFVEGWRVMGRADGTRPELPGFAEDGIWMTSSDVAVLLYRAEGCWRFAELGY